MAINEINVDGVNTAIETLTRFAKDEDNIFRGHSNKGWRLESTLARHVFGKQTELSIQSMGETLNHFYACLAAAGKLPVDYSKMTPRIKLEYARHYGVPSPLIDFTKSPFVALWMAFNGVRPWEPGSVVVYVLNVNGLGLLWRNHSGGRHDAFVEFRWSELTEQFAHGYDVEILRYLEFPTSWNTRMLRQLGVFIYDSLRYEPGTLIDLEQFIERGADPDGHTLHKIIIPKVIASDVFARLELMGIDGTRLYDDYEGAAADVKNGYVFNRRTGYAHDILVRQPPAP